MKYEVATCDRNENMHVLELNIRSDAHYMTVLKKCADAMAEMLVKDGIASYPVRYSVERGNIWTNGGYGAVWVEINDGSNLFVAITRDGHAYC